MSTVVVELYEALKQAGVDQMLARDAASAVVPANAMAELATKHELKHELFLLRTEMKHEFSAVRTDMKHEFSAVRAEMKHEFSAARAEMKADMSELKAELIKWNLSAMAILTAIFAAIAGLT